MVAITVVEALLRLGNQLNDVTLDVLGSSSDNLLLFASVGTVGILDELFFLGNEGSNDFFSHVMHSLDQVFLGFLGGDWVFQLAVADIPHASPVHGEAGRGEAHLSDTLAVACVIDLESLHEV